MEPLPLLRSHEPTNYLISQKWTQTSCMQLLKDLSVIAKYHLHDPRYRSDDTFEVASSAATDGIILREALYSSLKGGTCKLETSDLIDLIPCYLEFDAENSQYSENDREITRLAQSISHENLVKSKKEGEKKWMDMESGMQHKLRDLIVHASVNQFMDARKEFQAAITIKKKTDQPPSS